MTIIPGTLSSPYYYNSLLSPSSEHRGAQCDCNGAISNNYPVTNMKGHVYVNHGNLCDAYIGAANYFPPAGIYSPMFMYGGYYGAGAISPFVDYNRLYALNGFNNYIGVYPNFYYPPCPPVVHKLDIQEPAVDIENNEKPSKKWSLKDKPFLKGALAAATIIATPILLIKSRKKPEVNQSFWSKLNPKNWFKKNNSSQNTSQSSNFWSKLNPKNWGKKR